ncbi:hypothetical protein SLS62_001053 [Diatrype stigma]|uniref:DUF7025 domain-containing protein n=1 Tax=Diatrype stigma TaxID=117547 RepID=A0AAN9YWC7_9PEZI
MDNLAMASEEDPLDPNMATVPQLGEKDRLTSALMAPRNASPIPTRSVQEDDGTQDERYESPVEDDTKFEEETRIPREDRRITPEVRYYNFEGFMNRMVGDQGDYVIEVLVTNADWFEDIDAEMIKRGQRGNVVEYHGRQNEKPKDASKMQLKLAQGSKAPLDGRIHRVRIRSKAILDALSSVSRCTELLEGEKKGEDIFEFCRPFKLFEYCQVEMKNVLARMETAEKEKHDHSDTGLDGQEPMAANISGDKTTGTEHVPVLDEAQGSKEASDEGEEPRTMPTGVALQHMRCYVDFVEDIILPIRKRFERFDNKTRPKIKYEEIPYLFRSGALAFLPRKGMNLQTLQRSSVQQIWRMAFCRPVDALTRTTDLKVDSPEHNDPSYTKWGIYSLDYDGDNLVPIWHTVTFALFYGEREITSLECYPLEFHPGYESLLDEQSRSGQVFKSCITDSIRHLYYTGWTPMTGIRAEYLTDEKGEEIRYPEYIESEVVIDFKEALRNHPYWMTDILEPLDWSLPWYVEDNHILASAFGRSTPRGRMDLGAVTAKTI